MYVYNFLVHFEPQLQDLLKLLLTTEVVEKFHCTVSSIYICSMGQKGANSFAVRN